MKMSIKELFQARQYSAPLQSELQKVWNLSQITMQAWLSDPKSIEPDATPIDVLQKVLLTTAAITIGVEQHWKGLLLAEGKEGQDLLQACSITGCFEVCKNSPWYQSIIEATGQADGRGIEKERVFRTETKVKMCEFLRDYGVNLDAIAIGASYAWNFSARSIIANPENLNDVQIELDRTLLRVYSSEITSDIEKNKEGQQLLEIAKKIHKAQGFEALVSFASKSKLGYLGPKAHQSDYLHSMIAVCEGLKEELSKRDGSIVSVASVARIHEMLIDPLSTKNGLVSALDAKLARFTCLQILGSWVAEQTPLDLKSSSSPEALKKLGHLIGEFGTEFNSLEQPITMDGGGVRKNYMQKLIGKWVSKLKGPSLEERLTEVLAGQLRHDITVQGFYAAYRLGVRGADQSWFEPFSIQSVAALVETRSPWILGVIDCVCQEAQRISGVSALTLRGDLRSPEGLESSSWQKVWLSMQESALSSTQSANLQTASGAIKIEEFLDNAMLAWGYPDGMTHTKGVVNILKNNADRIVSELEANELLEVLSRTKQSVALSGKAASTKRRL